MYFRSFPHRAGRSRAGHDAQLLEEREEDKSYKGQNGCWESWHPSQHHSTFTEGGLGTHPLPCWPFGRHTLPPTVVPHYDPTPGFHEHTQSNGHTEYRATYRSIDPHGHPAPSKDNCATELFSYCPAIRFMPKAVGLLSLYPKALSWPQVLYTHLKHNPSRTDFIQLFVNSLTARYFKRNKSRWQQVMASRWSPNLPASLCQTLLGCCCFSTGKFPALGQNVLSRFIHRDEPGLLSTPGKSS